jgi:hypothetical protein
MVIRVGFKYDGKCLLAFEVKVKPQGDVFMFVFERGHRRMHVSYHQDKDSKYVPQDLLDAWGIEAKL